MFDQFLRRSLRKKIRIDLHCQWYWCGRIFHNIHRTINLDDLRSNCFQADIEKIIHAHNTS